MRDWYQIPMSKLSLNWDSQKGNFSFDRMLSRLSLLDCYFARMLSEDWYFAAGVFRKGCHYKNALFTDWELKNALFLHPELPVMYYFLSILSLIVGYYITMTQTKDLNIFLGSWQS